MGVSVVYGRDTPGSECSGVRQCLGQEGRLCGLHQGPGV